MESEKQDQLVGESAGWRFVHTYAGLPEALHRRVDPEPVPDPRLVLFNRGLAREMGLRPELLEGELGAKVFSGNLVPAGALPLAQAYAGHQFGHFTMLGDGRALLMGEHRMPDGKRVDVQWKGTGRTPYSRRGDGRAALGPMLREYVISEALWALHVPTTRSLAVTTTGAPVRRERELSGAVLTRVAASHIRVGTFEHASALGDVAVLRALFEYTAERHDPSVLEAENPGLAFLEGVVERQAALLAKWMNLGFIHGVMNTDNMAVSGESIDFGPCAFMDSYDPETVFSSIDHTGRYAYGRQPALAAWNLARLAEALLPLIDSDGKRAAEQAEEVVIGFENRFRKHWMTGMRSKLGLFQELDDDAVLFGELFAAMKASHSDFTRTFRALSDVAVIQGGEDFAAAPEGVPDSWLQAWRGRLSQQGEDAAESVSLMRRHNPVYIPRNHIVERALDDAQDGNMMSVEDLVEVLANPFEEQPEREEYAAPPARQDPGYRTFCGT